MNISELNKLEEVAFNPKTFGAAIGKGQEQGVLVGFEFEVCIPEKIINKIKIPKYVADYNKIVASYFKSRGTFMKFSTSDISTKKMDSLFKLKPEERPKFPTFTEAFKYAKEKNLDHDDYGELIRIIYRTSPVNIEDNLDTYFEYDGKKVYTFLNPYTDDYLKSALAYDKAQYKRQYGNSYKKVAKLLIEPELQSLYNTDVKTFYEYHQYRKDTKSWYIEPDSSLQPSNYDTACEIVSPPMPAENAMESLKKFYAFAKKYKFYTGTNNQTGLHINVSIPKNIDVLKLALFVGDKYALTKFNREDNSYAQSVLELLRSNAKDSELYKIKKGRGKSKMRSSNFDMKKLLDIAKRTTDGHYVSINNTGKYVSFRSAGGDYLNNYQDIVNIVGRFVQAMIIASDPELYKNEYIKKLTQLVGAPIASTQSKFATIRSIAEDIKQNGMPVIKVVFGNLKAPISTNIKSCQEELNIFLKYSNGYFGRYIDKLNYQIVPNYANGYKEVFNSRRNFYVPNRNYDLIPNKPEHYASTTLLPLSDVNLYSEYKNAVVKTEQHFSMPIVSGDYPSIVILADVEYLPYNDPIVQKFIQELKSDAMNESRQYPEQPTYYFAYGMLTNPKLMRGAELIGVGELKNFEYKMYQFANVEENTGHTTYGCLWEIDRTLLQKLDRMEGYPSMYDRKTYPVYVDGKKYVAEVFVMTPETRYYVQKTFPSRAYVEDVARGYLNAGVPTKQLTHAIEVARENLYT